MTDTLDRDTSLVTDTPESVGLSSAGLEKIDAYLHGLVDDGTLAGVVTLVARHGKTVHTSVMGQKDLASGEPLALDTIFRIFSMTKPVTGAAMSICWDEGCWTPDDPIEKHLPGFGAAGVFAGLDEAGQVKTVPAQRPATMRQLMTHTAGLRYGFDPNDPLDKLYQAAQVWQSASLAEFADKIAALPLAYEPGTKWQYSMSMDVQAALIERWTGLSAPDFYRTRLFEPLDMVDTAFHTPPQKVARRATLYRWSPTQKKLIESPPILGRDHDAPPALANGGGGLVSTARDYARFAQMLLNGGELDGVRVISREALAMQMSNHLSDELMAGGFGVGLQQIRPGYGHGFDGAVFCDPEAAGVPVGKGTYQWDGAAGTWFWVDPVHDLLYVGLIQRLAEQSPHLQKITQTMMADAYLD
ncbi:MAG TPA: serine hydrolase domain-containing protein [Caulobacteraceae bacterium]|nr:serine hydrolase domain-containing protein [Caulobacteraceae bacterium]